MSTLFTPPVGELVTRLVVTPNGIDMTICFRTREDDLDYYKSIVTIKEFVCTPSHCTFYDSARYSAQLTPTVIRYLTTWDELCVIPRLWGSWVPMKDWLDEVMQEPALLESQKSRITKALGKVPL